MAGLCDQRERDGESGYVLAMSALLMIPLLIFTAFAVDVGAWYLKAADIQTASDASSLAAVVHMPSRSDARAAALDSAARNGYIDQPGCDAWGDPCLTPTAFPQVVVDETSGQSVKVTVIDRAEVYFGQLVLADGPVIERFAQAEYVLPVPLGNPSSALGTGNLGGAAGVENLWLAVNGYCSGRQQGDAISAAYQYGSWYCPGAWSMHFNVPQPWASDYGLAAPRYYDWRANGTQGGRTDNPQYDVNGYELTISMPAGSEAKTWNVDFYEPGVCNSVGEFNFGLQTDLTNSHVPVVLQTTLFKADNTPLSDADNTTPHGAGTIDWATNSCGWQTGYSIGPGDPRGRWLLNYRSRPITNELGINYFGVRVVPAAGNPGAGVICTSLSDATCPQVAAKEHLPIFVPGRATDGTPMATPGAPATFFLAEIDAGHAGKTLEITLFDPGEGMEDLQIIDPNGNRPTFTYRTIDTAEYGISTTTNTATPMTDLPIANNDMCGLARCLDTTSSRFQNRTVRIEIPLSSYTCGATCWWTIRYAPEGTGVVTDRTTWSVRVIGDPVRLSE
jgi:hypothetical protein